MVNIDKILPNFMVSALIAAIVGACSRGDGTGFILGTFDVASCNLENKDQDLEVDFFTASYFENTLTLRLQHTGVDQVFADGVFIEVRDVAYVAENLGTPLTVELEPPLDDFILNGPETGVGANTGLPETTYQSPARVSLYLNETCPDNTLGFTDGAGTVTFYNIYRPGHAKRIRGELDLLFVDPRTWESPDSPGESAAISGEFDFEYSRSKPEQTFL